MTSRIAISIILLMSCPGCAVNQASPKNYEAADMPDSDVALIKTVEFKSAIVNERKFFIRYFDAVEDKQGFFSYMHGKILPGRHTLGILVNWGDVCLPAYIATACFNECYSGVVLNAVAGNKYSFNIEKNKDEVHLVVSDESGAVVARNLCESISIPFWGLPDSSNTPTIKSIHERLERESKESEMR